MAKPPKEDEQKTERFNMFLSPSESKAIDDWAWKNRVRSKSEAVRRLVQSSLQVDGEIDEIYKRTVELNVLLAALSVYPRESVKNLKPEEEPDWKDIATFSVLWTAALRTRFDEFKKSISYITEQVHLLRSDRDFSDLKKEAEDLAIKAKEDISKNPKNYFEDIRNVIKEDK